MGYDERTQSNSTGTLIAVIGVGLLLAILGIAVVAAVGLFWVRSVRMDSAVAVEARQRAVEAKLRAEAETLRSVLEEARVETTVETKSTLQLNLDREGNIRADGNQIELDALKARLAKFKVDASDTLSVDVMADPECPAKHIMAVLEVCDEVGSTDVRIVSSNDANVSPNDANVRITAVVASYEPAAEWDHFEDGTFSAYDTLTLKIIDPKPRAGTTLAVTVPPTELPQDSAFRTAGTHITFTLPASDLTAARLFWGLIESPIIVHLPHRPPSR